MEVPQEIHVKYVERKRKDLEVCAMALGEGNFPQIEKVGHQLKGNGVTFGHPELSEIGKRLEKAGSTKDKDLINSALEEFKNWVISQNESMN